MFVEQFATLLTLVWLLKKLTSDQETGAKAT
jgi:hypothetical protein